jgi:AbrB family looped-hinge helix DNA binding protein
MITTVTGKNQITIPSKIARAAGIQPGTRVDWIVSDDPAELRCIILPAPPTVASRLRGAGKHLLKPGQDPIADLLAERLAEEALS